ncbi:hypothetical protein KP79_PYT17161 [Mizuhopecten yessoensis]|uniref:MADF domain-containing protein n=1 Tax=Mizuhopecten yessoensis TaxID=6573 RepID=A0A210QHR2_MIZYE|nr:hypothetical protein KP79_PYT17161 [Mizuhopecten yessoensis]
MHGQAEMKICWWRQDTTVMKIFVNPKIIHFLWKEITNEVGSVTALQAMHKYNNVKKRWKEVLDSGTGTEAKYLRHREAFDQQYGTRSSTKPAFTIDSACADDEEKEAFVKGSDIAAMPKKRSEIEETARGKEAV